MITMAMSHGNGSLIRTTPSITLVTTLTGQWRDSPNSWPAFNGRHLAPQIKLTKLEVEGKGKGGGTKRKRYRTMSKNIDNVIPEE